MNFIDAVKAALDDNKVRRKDWHYTHYIYQGALTLEFSCLKKQFIFDDLKKLGELKIMGVLTEEEFNDKKKELLNKII